MRKPENEKRNSEQLRADAEAKRLELEARYKGKVNAAILSMGKEDKPCVVYFSAATTFTKMQCMDLSYQSPSKASAMLFDATVIKEASDARVFDRDNDNDAYYLGAIDYCLGLIMVARDLLKKN